MSRLVVTASSAIVMNDGNICDLPKAADMKLKKHCIEFFVSINSFNYLCGIQSIRPVDARYCFQTRAFS